MPSNSTLILSYLLLPIVFLSACGNNEKASDNIPSLISDSVQDSTDIIAVIDGLSGPEAVRYDSEMDSWFIANFNGSGGQRDSNGFISLAGPDLDLRDTSFITGTEAYPLHAPRGMFIRMDTLWVADVDGVHQFNKKTGQQIGFVNFRELGPGFLNDVSGDGNGRILVTDTGTSRVYEILRDKATILQDSLPSAPNGITFDPSDRSYLLAPWGGDSTFYKIDRELREAGTFSGGYFDGIEYYGSQVLAASQADPGIRLISNSNSQVIIQTTGRPADIGLNRKKLIIAVPYIALNKVEFWQLRSIGSD